MQGLVQYFMFQSFMNGTTKCHKPVGFGEERLIVLQFWGAEVENQDHSWERASLMGWWKPETPIFISLQKANVFL